MQQSLWKALVLLYFAAFALAILAMLLRSPITGYVAATAAVFVWSAAFMLLIKESYDEQAAR